MDYELPVNESKAYECGFADGIGMGKLEMAKQIQKYMIDTFGGDDGSDNLNKLYEYIQEQIYKCLG